MNDAPHIFISHSSKNNKVALQLATDLRSAGAYVWLDVTNLAHGDFVQIVDEQIRSSEWIFLLISPDSIQSPYVQLEISAAFILLMNKEIKGIIPILVESCEEQTIPAVWRTLHRYDLTSDYSITLLDIYKIIGLSNTTLISQIRPDRRPIKLLIADKDKDILIFLPDALSLMHKPDSITFEIQTASDGYLALQHFFQFQPDCVVFDVVLRGFDAFQLVRILRSDPRNADVAIIITDEIASVKTEDIKASGQVDAFLLKPFKVDILIDTIIATASAHNRVMINN